MIIERKIYSEIKKYLNSPEIIVITGMRRVGKTTLLKYIMERIDSDNKIYIDLENPANQRLFDESDYDRIVSNLKLFNINFKSKSYIFLDEVQLLNNIPSVIKYLSDNYNIKFFLTGSASFYLKNLFTESLAGRKYIFELYPFSFEEFLMCKAPNLIELLHTSPITQSIYERLDNYYEEYLLYGGFPGVVLKEDFSEKKLMLEDIFSSYFHLEVLRLSDFKKTNVIRELIFLLMERAGSKIDILKISDVLSVSRETITNYLYFLENTYFIKLIKPYSRNRDVEIRHKPKIYLCDTGLLNHFSKVDNGSIFENSVFLNLLPKGKVNYYQKKTGIEIDFILNESKAFEVKINPANQDLKRLERVSEELNLSEYFIVSKKFSMLPKVLYGFQI